MIGKVLLLGLILALIDPSVNAQITPKSAFSDTSDAIIQFERIDYNRLSRLIFEATNEARQAEKLQPLAYSRALEKAAFEHSLDMAENGFFSHQSIVPKKKRLADRLQLVGIPMTNRAENIATTFAGQSSTNSLFPNDYQRIHSPKQPIGLAYEEVAKMVVQQWLRSPGHRANILNPNLVYLGCGAMLRPMKDVAETPVFIITQCFSSDDSSLRQADLPIDYEAASEKSAAMIRLLFRKKP